MYQYRHANNARKIQYGLIKPIQNRLEIKIAKYLEKYSKHSLYCGLFRK
jgi:hypothetical protein